MAYNGKNNQFFTVNFYCRINGSACQSAIYNNFAPVVGTWYHVSGRRSGTDWRLFLNGISVASTQSSTTNFHNINDIRIGGGSSANHVVDDARVYNRALSDAEIAYLAQGNQATQNSPQTWTIPTHTSAWGARLSSTSTDTDADAWGTDGVNEKWSYVPRQSAEVVQRMSETSNEGSTQVLKFRVEVGDEKIQPTGTYQATVELIASAR